jgi:hypothetical protein
MADISPLSADPKESELELLLVDEVEVVDEVLRLVKSEALCRPEINMTEGILSLVSLNRGPLNPFESLVLTSVCWSMRGNVTESKKADSIMESALG